MVSVYVGTKEEGRKGWRESRRMMLKGKKHLLQAGNFQGQFLFSIFNFFECGEKTEHLPKQPYQQKAKALERKDDLQNSETYQAPRCATNVLTRHSLTKNLFVPILVI